MNHWITAKADHPGARPDQQDRVETFTDPANDEYLILVSDGVGGQAGGSLASQAVVSTATMLWGQRSVQQSSHDFLYELCRRSHDEINRIGVQESVAPRATIAAVYVRGERACLAHSGDSRVYRFVKADCIERTEDHSVLETLVKKGKVKEEEMGTHPDQGMLLQSLGGKDFVEPSFQETRVSDRDGFLVCTDGFWERISREEAGKVVNSGDKLDQLLVSAVKTAARRGGQKSDNIAAAVLVSAPRGFTAALGSVWLWAAAAVVAIFVGVLIVYSFLFSGSSKNDARTDGSVVVANATPPAAGNEQKEGKSEAEALEAARRLADKANIEKAEREVVESKRAADKAAADKAAADKAAADKAAADKAAAEAEQAKNQSKAGLPREPSAAEPPNPLQQTTPPAEERPGKKKPPADQKANPDNSGTTAAKSDNEIRTAKKRAKLDKEQAKLDAEKAKVVKEEQQNEERKKNEEKRKTEEDGKKNPGVQSNPFYRNGSNP